MIGTQFQRTTRLTDAFRFTKMDKDQIRHKCGYCGWLFTFTTNFLEHECFKHYAEGEDRIYVDENYVVTIYGTKTAKDPATDKDTLDELLIGAVKRRRALYDYSTPAYERSNLRKNALWTEVSNTLGGALTPEEAKARWKYLRDNYMKARKKFKSYIPSGSAAETTNEQKKPKFRFYDLMKFLNDVFDTRQTISSLSDDIAKNATYTIPEQHENDIVASSSGFTDISLQTPTIHASSSMLTSTRVRTPTQTSVTPRTSTSNNVLLQSPTLSVTSRILASNSRKSLQTADYDSDVSQRMPAAKKQKSDALQIALIEALKEPPAQATDPLDGFLARLGEGMRRLPYRDRARLEIQFLTLLAEKEDIYAHNDPNTELPTRY